MSLSESVTLNKKLINKTSLTQPMIDYINNLICSEDATFKHYFHKIMIYNWGNTAHELYESMVEYFSTSFIPVKFSSQNLLTTFYTNNLNLIMQILRFNFLFPFKRSMFNVDILFNDKTSYELFNKEITVDDIVNQAITKRINGDYELDLSNFCYNSDFLKNKIHFYKLSLLSNFKILMIRIGRDTKMLNLSYNKLSQVPQDVMNFFNKENLLSVNLSNNNITAITELHKLNSKIEKLWTEGNPLCQDLDAPTYIKEIVKKFPRLKELDGIRINNYGFSMPFHKNFMNTDSYTRSKIIVEQFVSMYFAHYDSNARYKVGPFYDEHVQVTLSCNLSDLDKKLMPKIVSHSRNLYNPTKTELILNDTKMYRTRDAAVGMLCDLPASRHELSSFQIDVLHHSNNTIICVIDGMFQEPNSIRFFNFRRTLIFKEVQCAHQQRLILITCEMFNISLSTKELIQNNFKNPIRHVGELPIIDPTYDDREVLIRIFTNLTLLKKPEAEARLVLHSWDLRESIAEFKLQLESNMIGKDKFLSDEEFSDSVSDLFDEID